MKRKIFDCIETVIYYTVTITAFSFIAAVLCVAGCVVGMLV